MSTSHVTAAFLDLREYELEPSYPGRNTIKHDVLFYGMHIVCSDSATSMGLKDKIFKLQVAIARNDAAVCAVMLHHLHEDSPDILYMRIIWR